MNKFFRLFFIGFIFYIIITPSLLLADDPPKDPFYTKGDPLPLSEITERVDPFSGYLTIVQRDIHLPGNGGLDLDIVRTYNSCIWGRRDTGFPGLIAYNERSPLGIGWSLHMGIVRNPYGTGSANRYLPDNPVVELPDGSQHILFRDKSDSTRFITREYWIYKNVGTGKWELTLTDGTKYTFEYNTNAGYDTFDGVKIAQVTSIAHPNGVSKITIYYYKYAGYSYIDKIQDSAGRYIYFYYNYATHRLTSISEAGITYNYYYSTISSYNFLSEVAPPVGNRWEYTYSTSTYDLTKVTYPYGGTIDYAYSDIYFDTGAVDVKFRVVTQRRTGGRNVPVGTWTYSYNSGGASGDVTTVTAPDGFEEEYTYYGWGNSGNGNVWRIGLPISKKVYKSNSLILTENYTWNKSASYISYDEISNANWSGTIGFIYDSDIYLPLLTSKSITRDGKTYTTNYSNYDSYGNPETKSESGDKSRTKSISYWYNTSKNIVQNKPSSETISGDFPGTFTTTYTYDSDGNLIQLNKYGVVTNYSYYSNGNLYYERDANNNTTYYWWDKGVINKIQTPEYTINRVINDNGTIASETNGRGYTTYFTYDGNLRLTSIDPPAGNTTYFTYPSDNSYKKATRGSFYTYYYYDGFGRPMGTSNSKGVDTYIVYKSCGLKDYFDSEIGEKVYYDDFGRVKQVVHKDGQDINYFYSGSNVTMTNETNDQTVYTYNAFGDPDEKFLVAVKDPLNNTTSYGRNVLGSLTSITQGSITRSFSYNSKNFLTSETHPETGTITYSRDNVGNMTSRQDSSGTRYYTYDGMNRLIKITYGSNTVSFGYDGANNRTSMTSPSASITYIYDAANRLTQKSEAISGRTYTTTYSYDGNDNITGIGYPSGRYITYSYNSNNEVTAVSGFGGSATSFNYNLAGLPTSFNYSNGKSTTLSYNSRYFTTGIVSTGVINLGYSHDSRGNITAISNSPYNSSQSFSYDSIDRLTSFSSAWGSGSFTYDSSGNRLSKKLAGVTTSYSYSSNRLSSTSGGEQATYSYNGNGTLKQLQTGGNTYDLVYDGFGNLIKYSTGGTIIAEFEYDGDGIRIKKVSDGKTVIYHYDQDGHVISEDDGTNLIADYIYANGKLIAKVANDAFIIPTAPINLTATAISSSQINLSWTDNSNNETGFKIERKTGADGTYSQIATVGANVTSYSNTGLSPNTTYYYRVRAYNAGGDSNYSNEAYATTNATNIPPTANAGGPYSGTEGQAITLNGSGSTDPDGSIVLYEWDIDNNGTYDYSSPSPTRNHTYIQQGTYTIKLKVTDNLGAISEALTTASISDTFPTASFTGSPTSGTAPLTVNFTNNSTGYDQPLSHKWDFDNDGVIDSTAQNPSYIYANQGIYTVKLTVTDSDGSSNSLTRVNYITVSGCLPPVRIYGVTPVYYNSIQDAYNAASDGDIIQTQDTTLIGDLNINRNISITFEGGYSCNYTAITGKTIINGNITITNGIVAIGGLVLN